MSKKQVLINIIKSKQVFIWVTLFIYAVITLLILLRHEPWRDEAQAWLISRDLSIIDIVKQMKYEGHPALWSLLLAPFAKLGLPYISMNIVSWLLTCCASWLLLACAPFKRLVKICVLGGAAFVYLYPVIARNYALIPLLLFAIAVLFPKQSEKPLSYGILIALLANTHVIMLGFAGALSLLFAVDNILLKWKSLSRKKLYKYIVAFFVMVIGMIFVYLQLSGSLGINTNIDLHRQISLYMRVKDELVNCSKSLLGEFTLLNNIFGDFINKFYLLTLVFLLGFMALILCCWTKLLFIFISGVGFQIVLYLFIYNSNPQRANSILLIFIFCIWIGMYGKIEKNKFVNKFKFFYVKSFCVSAGICILFILTVPYGFKCVLEDWNENYSSGKSTALYISQNISEDSLIISHVDFTTTSLMPYLPKYKFWISNLNNYATFVTWDGKRVGSTTPKDWINTINDKFYDSKKIYLLISISDNYANIDKYDKDTLSHFKLLFQSKEAIVYDEVYRIYEYLR